MCTGFFTVFAGKWGVFTILKHSLGMGMTDRQEQSQRNPFPTVDVIIHDPERGIVLVERRNHPHGWALPGGFVDTGESVEEAAVREAQEETGLRVQLTDLLGVYSNPERDPRFHTMSVVFVGRAEEPHALKGGDDAAAARFFPLRSWGELAFDHGMILEDYLSRLEGGMKSGVVGNGRSVCCNGC